MPVKTKPKPRSNPRRATSYRPRPSSGARRRPARKPSLNFAKSLKAPQAVWLAGGGLAVAVITVILTASLLIDGLEALLRTFGLCLGLLVAGIAVDTRIALRKPHLDARFLRLVGGSHMLGLFAFGLAAMFKPEMELGDVSFLDVTAGGNLGRTLIGGPLPVLGWLAAGLSGLGLVWPRGAYGVWQVLCAAGRYIDSLHIPQNIWEALRAFFSSLVPKSADGDDKLLAEPYVPQWDEEWAESPALPEPEEDTAPAEPPAP